MIKQTHKPESAPRWLEHVYQHGARHSIDPGMAELRPPSLHYGGEPSPCHRDQCHRDSIDPGMVELRPPSLHHGGGPRRCQRDTEKVQTHKEGGNQAVIYGGPKDAPSHDEDMVIASPITNDDLRHTVLQIVQEEYRPITAVEVLPASKVNRGSQDPPSEQRLDHDLEAQAPLQESSAREKSFEHIVTLPRGSVGLRFEKDSCPPVIASFKQSCKIVHKLNVGDRITAFILPNGTRVKKFDTHELHRQLKDYESSRKRKLVVSSTAAPDEHRSPHRNNKRGLKENPQATNNHGRSKNRKTRIYGQKKGAKKPKVDRTVVMSDAKVMPDGSRVEEIKYSDGTIVKKTLKRNIIPSSPLGHTIDTTATEPSILGRVSENYTCQYCGYQGPTVVKAKVGTCTVIGLSVIIICFLPLFWLPLVMPSCKDKEHVCANCHHEVGESKANCGSCWRCV